jgi:hypothetical protein
MEAAAFQKIGTAVNQLTEALKMVGATSEIGQAIMKGMTTLAKVIPPGSVNPQSESNNLQQAEMKNQQNRMMNQQMRGIGGAPQQPSPAPTMPQAA